MVWRGLGCVLGYLQSGAKLRTRKSGHSPTRAVNCYIEIYLADPPSLFPILSLTQHCHTTIPDNVTVPLLTCTVLTAVSAAVTVLFSNNTVRSERSDRPTLSVLRDMRCHGTCSASSPLSSLSDADWCFRSDAPTDPTPSSDSIRRPNSASLLQAPPLFWTCSTPRTCRARVPGPRSGSPGC